MATNDQLMTEVAKITDALRSLGVIDRDTSVAVDFGSSTQGIDYRVLYARTEAADGGEVRHVREESRIPDWVGGWEGRIGRTRGEALRTLETARAALSAAVRARTLTDD